MPIKITKRITAKVSWERTKSDFHRIIQSSNALVDRIKELILKGISPVMGKKFPKYSKSYISQIKGDVRFYTNPKTGKVYPVNLKNGKKSKRVSPADTLFASKKQSPVNLHLSGDMLRSLKSNGNDKQTFVEFTDDKAQWHNDGEGKLPERRILPNRSGERWHRIVTEYLNNALREALRRYFKK